MAKDSLHQQKFAGQCSACHAEVNPEPGPGHRAISPCIACHNPRVVTTHTPPGNPLACTQCHEPHGTDNIRLIRDVIQTPAGGDRPMHFDNLTGFADGSFASPSAPGMGLCEVCHTQTQFYRADGTGAPHPRLQCTTCHRHEAGFTPQ
jgi:predicted CXXCH cytochrome family protein